MQTPCISVCAIDPASGLCIGCRRTLAEIGGWSAFSDKQRGQLMDSLPLRTIGPKAGAALTAGRDA
ncbi:DUF1289 domain-containing protein [Rhizobium sp. S152]|nr:DUF1289 domain-containing protein [Rhizobium sp. S152]MDM9628330.1 DUF1289 domain-containing protein [Rhizobium sp. S152]